MGQSRFGPRWCVCRGKECFGGGNPRCAQRDPKISRIAGILDSYGGGRVVVTYKRNFKHHVRAGEFLCIVPDKRVHEPIAWNDVPFVVRLGEMAIESFVEANAFTNDPEKREAITMWKLRRLEQNQRSLHLPDIVFT